MDEYDSDEFIDVEDIGNQDNGTVLFPSEPQQEVHKEREDIILHPADLASKDLIEKMLDEERLFTSGKSMKSAKAPRLHFPGKKIKNDCRWTSEEMGLFQSGVEIFGDKEYDELADLIQTKSVNQVRAYARRLRRKQNENITTVESNTPATAQPTVKQTAQPTVSFLDKSKIKTRKRRATDNKQHKQLPKWKPIQGTVAKIEYVDEEDEIVDVVDDNDQGSRSQLVIVDECADRTIEKKGRHLEQRPSYTIATETDYGKSSLQNCELVSRSESLSQTASNEDPISSTSKSGTLDEGRFPSGGNVESINEYSSDKMTELHRRRDATMIEVNNEQLHEPIEKSPETSNDEILPATDGDGHLRTIFSDTSDSEAVIMDAEISEYTSSMKQKYFSSDDCSEGILMKSCDSVENEVARSDETYPPTRIHCILSHVDASDSEKGKDRTNNASKEVDSSLEKWPQSNRDSSDELDHIKESKTDHVVSGVRYLPSDRFYLQDGGYVPLAVPHVERILDPLSMEEDEQRIFTMFLDVHNFRNRTPHDYLKIRNHLVKFWQASRPRYVNKATSRMGLNYDVIIVGKIHSFLERVGAINFGCEEARYNTSIGWTDPKSRKNKHSDPSSAATVARIWTTLSRKRRIRLNCGHWKMADDDSNCNACESALKWSSGSNENVVTKRKTMRKCSDNIMYDPFSLVECRHFDQNGRRNDEQPYHVELTCSALVTVECHSLLSSMEVIGMLGGEYHETNKTLRVLMAQPCESSSTEIQCEMDPVSQVDAICAIQDAGLSVVGWYHSHPKFTPDPSVRDVETQQFMQEYLATTTSTPFIGIITQSYNVVRPVTRCLTVVTDSSSTENGVPYALKYALSVEEPMSYERLLDKLEHLLTSVAGANYHGVDSEMLRENFARVMKDHIRALLSQRFPAAEKMSEVLISKMNSLPIQLTP